MDHGAAAGHNRRTKLEPTFTSSVATYSGCVRTCEAAGCRRTYSSTARVNPTACTRVGQAQPRHPLASSLSYSASSGESRLAQQREAYDRSATSASNLLRDPGAHMPQGGTGSIAYTIEAQRVPFYGDATGQQDQSGAAPHSPSATPVTNQVIGSGDRAVVDRAVCTALFSIIYMPLHLYRGLCLGAARVNRP